jgi:hypothetical protein
MYPQSLESAALDVESDRPKSASVIFFDCCCLYHDTIPGGGFALLGTSTA